MGPPESSWMRRRYRRLRGGKDLRIDQADESMPSVATLAADERFVDRHRPRLRIARVGEFAGDVECIGPGARRLEPGGVAVTGIEYNGRLAAELYRIDHGGLGVFAGQKLHFDL